MHAILNYLLCAWGLHRWSEWSAPERPDPPIPGYPYWNTQHRHCLRCNLEEQRIC